MRTNLKFLLILGGVMISASITAQSLSSVHSAPVMENLSLTSSEEAAFLDPQDAFFLDLSSKVCFIDFESLKQNIKSVQLVSAKGETLLQDRVDHLPVNSIYELNLNALPSGRYQIVLEGYIGEVTKSFSF
ncbi:MAG: hypothetical protein IPJ06_13235 [Saprospiraceae bacterium]|nr:hypothetical protein [Saprospiraceae bacterium]